jgi:hypothetical protein
MSTDWGTTKVTTPAMAQLHACRLSREVALKYQQAPIEDYHEIENQLFDIPGSISSDVVWFIDAKVTFDSLTHVNEAMRSADGKLAMGHDQWLEAFVILSKEKKCKYLVDLLSTEIRELILVVGGTKLSGRRDVVFIESQKSPQEEYSSNPLWQRGFTFWCENWWEFLRINTWALLESEISKHFEKLKSQIEKSFRKGVLLYW